MQFLQTYLVQWIGQKAMYDLRSAIFSHIQKLPVKFFDKNPVGRLVTRVTTDVESLHQMLSSGAVAIFGDIFTLDAEQTITSIKGKNETIIFQIGLNDFFNVMANQHELAQEFIKSVSKDFAKDLSPQ